MKFKYSFSRYTTGAVLAVQTFTCTRVLYPEKDYSWDSSALGRVSHSRQLRIGESFTSDTVLLPTQFYIP